MLVYEVKAQVRHLKSSKHFYVQLFRLYCDLVKFSRISRPRTQAITTTVARIVKTVEPVALSHKL